MPLARLLLVPVLIAGATAGCERMEATAPGCRVDGQLTADAATALLQSCERAVPAVLDAWPQWTGDVLIEQAAGPLPAGIAARVEGLAREGEPTTGDRLVVTPGLTDELSSAGLDVVLRHELTHLAMRSTGTAALPLWVAEGLAEHLAYASVVDERATRSGELEQLRARVDAGTWTGTVPSRAQLDGDDGRDPRAAYVAAWLGVTVLIDERGLQEVTAAMAPPRRASAGAQTEPETAFLARLGLTREDLDQLWRAGLDAPS